MPTYRRPLKGFRYVNGKKVIMDELTELRALARYKTRPNSTQAQRELAHWAITELREKYPGKGIFRPNKEED